MKSAFKILPVIEQGVSNQLLVEIGYGGISLLFFTKEPFKVEGLLAYNFANNLSGKEIEDTIKNIISSEEILRQNFSAVNVIYNFKEATLVPKQFYSDDVKDDVLALIFGSNKNTIAYNENLSKKDIVNVYRVDREITDVMTKAFPFLTTYHSNTLLLTLLPGEGNTLAVTIYHNSIKVILQSEDTIQLAQQFYYDTASDIIYHLLNVCAQHELPASSVNLLISGMIDERSNLYAELYKYFLNIQFQQLPAGTLVAEKIGQHPTHFFSHLISLASCV